MIVKTGANGDLTRVRDVGRVELGAQTYGQFFNLDGQQAAGLAIFQSPGANALDVAGKVDARMKELAGEFPQGLAYSIPFNTTIFVSQAIDEVYKTLLEAAVLVLIVILVFLQDWRAMLVPATTVPVTIIGAFAAMAALGFSVNLSTLFAIVLAIGIVVDDAIVVVEGAAHNMENGMSGHDAAIAAMNALFGPIIGITLVLMAVFLPAAFLPGLTGQMYAQFALVIAATALISAINAATLKPTQCATWLRRPVPPDKRNVFFRGFNAVYQRAGERLRPPDRLHGASQRGDGHHRAGDHRRGRLRHVARRHRFHSDRGPGLSARCGAASRRRRARPHAGDAAAGFEDRQGNAGRRPGHHHRRHIGARQQLDARQCRRRLHHAQGLERARQGRGSRRRSMPTLNTEPADDGGRQCPGAAAAADPGHRQRRRLHHAGRVA